MTKLIGVASTVAGVVFLLRGIRLAFGPEYEAILDGAILIWGGFTILYYSNEQ